MAVGGNVMAIQELSQQAESATPAQIAERRLRSTGASQGGRRRYCRKKRYYKRKSSCSSTPSCSSSSTSSSSSSSSTTSSSTDKSECDIVLAGTSPRIFASSCLDVPPHFTQPDLTGVHNPAGATASNGRIDRENGLGHINHQECVLADEIGVGGSGVLTRQQTWRNTGNAGTPVIVPNGETRSGYGNGWWADWVKSWDLSLSRETHDANHEFVDINFPCNVEVSKFRVQGIQTLGVGGGTMTTLQTQVGGPVPNTPPAAGVDQVLVSIPQTVEFHCNDGCDWYSLKNGDADKDDKWKKLSELITTAGAASQASQYDNIHKFSTGLSTDPQKIFTQEVPKSKRGWKSCRIVFDTFTGTVLGARVGIIVKDPTGAVCGRKCCTCPEFKSKCKCAGW